MKSKRALARCLAVATAMGLAALIGTAGIDPASAKSSRDKHDEFNQSRPGAPLLAVVALGEQRVTIYNAEGKMLQSPVSSGATGLETPAGIYSVVQKNEVHQSNVYEDGNMPFMQRITWTGIALHAGVLPGQPASHGCVRMPLAFAQRLFPMTDIGLRVIVVRDDIVPADIAHPALFKPNPARKGLALATPPAGQSSDSSQAARMNISASDNDPPLGSPRFLELLKSKAAAKSAESDAATKRAADARQLAARKAAEAGPATKTMRAAEVNLAKAEEQLKALERAPESPTASPEAAQQAETVKAKAAAKVAEAQAQLATAKTQAQAKMDAATRADEDAKAAETARELAVDAATEASHKTLPVSVFISRKTQRLYIRQGYKPVFEAPIAIRDADQPLGSYVFTAMNYLNNGADVRWSVVSMYKAGGKDAEPTAAQGTQRRKGEPRSSDGAPADVAGAKAALDRVTIPPDALERISDVVLPGSSLIISDEGASIETGKDTDFVVLMSGEPQGGIKTRRREQPRFRDNDYFFGGGGGSFFPFFN